MSRRSSANVEAARQTIAGARLVIFDFDGVIADSEELQCEVWRELFAQWGVPIDALPVPQIAGLPDRDIVAQLRPGCTASVYQQMIDEKVARCYERRHEIPLIPGAKRLLESLQGQKPIYICSTSSADDIQWFLQRQLPELSIEGIVGAGHYLRQKPAPDPYLKVLERAAVPAAAAAAIEDSRPGVQAALGAGVSVVQLDRYSANSVSGIPVVGSLEQLCEGDNEQR